DDGRADLVVHIQPVEAEGRCQGALAIAAWHRPQRRPWPRLGEYALDEPPLPVPHPEPPARADPLRDEQALHEPDGPLGSSGRRALARDGRLGADVLLASRLHDADFRELHDRQVTWNPPAHVPGQRWSTSKLPGSTWCGSRIQPLHRCPCSETCRATRPCAKRVHAAVFVGERCSRQARDGTGTVLGQPGTMHKRPTVMSDLTL